MRIRSLVATFGVVASSLVGVAVMTVPAAAAAPANDLLANAQVLTGETGSVSGTTAGATWTPGEPDGYDPNNSDPDFTHSVWFKISVPDDLGMRFSIPYPAQGFSVGTFVSYDGGALQLLSDDYSANGWAAEVQPGVYDTVAAFASTAVIDYSHDAFPSTAVYYVRVKSTTAVAGSFTLNWAEAGLPTTTTAEATADVDAGTFQIQVSTTCVRSFYEGAPPTPVDPANTGYYIVRDSNGDVVGAKRRWDLPDSSGTMTIPDLPLLPGSHNYSVRFYYGSQYAYCARSQDQVSVGDPSTTTTLSAVVSRQKVTFTGSVTPAPPPGASIQIREAGNSVVGLVLSDGSATDVATGVRPGKHTYIGYFESPFSTYTDSQSAPIVVTVPKYVTATSLAAPTTVRAGARPTVKARVLVGKTLAKGSVVFRLNGTRIATRTLVKGLASLQLPRLRRGKATVTVTYVATSMNASSKATRTITVTR